MARREGAGDGFTREVGRGRPRTDRNVCPPVQKGRRSEDRHSCLSAPAWAGDPPDQRGSRTTRRTKMAGNSEEMKRQLDQFRSDFTALRQEIGKVIVGHG